MRIDKILILILLSISAQNATAMEEEFKPKKNYQTANTKGLKVMNAYIRRNSFLTENKEKYEKPSKALKLNNLLGFGTLSKIPSYKKTEMFRSHSELDEIDWHKQFQMLYGDFNASISGDIKDARNQQQFMHLYMGLSRMINSKGLDVELEHPLLGVTARALSIAGGGIKGISAAEWLKTLEYNVSTIRQGETSIKRMFHLVAGTSTGGILAAFATLPISGMNMNAAQNFYFDHAKDIFSQNSFNMGGMTSSKYMSDGLLNVAYGVVGQLRMSDCEIPTIITTYNGTDRNLDLLSSEAAKIDPMQNYYMVDALRATSAAPSYFSPVLIYNQAKGTNKDFFNRFRVEKAYDKWGGFGSHVPAKIVRRDSILNPRSYGRNLRHGVMLDGGVNVNNPTMQALVEVGKKWGPIVNEIVMVNVGTGDSEESISYKDLKNAGALTHIRKGKLFEVMLDQDFVDQQVDGLASAFPYIKHFKLNVKLKDGTMDRTDTEFMENLRDITKAEINGGSKNMIRELSEILAKPTISLPSSFDDK